MSSKHSIKISRPAEPCSLYFWQGNQYFPQFFLRSGSRATLISTTAYKTEYLKSGPIADEFRNRSVLHTYTEADISLAPAGVPGFQMKDSANAPTTHLDIVVNGNIICQYGYKPGLDLSANPSYRIKVTEATPTRLCVENYHYASGKLFQTQSWDLLSSPPTNISGYTGMSVRYKSVYSDYAKAFNSYFKTADEDKVQWYGYQRLIYVGEVDLNRLPSDEDILDRIKLYKLPSIKPDILKESFYDDLLKQYALPDVNNIENMKDLKDIQKSIPPIADLLKKKNIKSLANMYLWYKYSYSTTKMDLESYYRFLVTWFKDSISKNAIKHTSVTYTSSASEGTATSVQTTRYNVYSDNYNCGVLKTLGLDLSMSNTWDLIPFSFVADWFINFGDVLRNLDNREVVSQISVHSVLTSNKNITTYYPLSDMGLYTLVRAVQYSRAVTKELPTPLISVSLLNPVRHTTDGLALIIARK